MVGTGQAVRPGRPLSAPRVNRAGAWGLGPRLRTRAVGPRFGVASAEAERGETGVCWLPRAGSRGTGTDLRPLGGV